MKRKINEENSSPSKRTKVSQCELMDLPNEMLEKIFKYLGPTEHRTAANVCRHWLEVVNEYFPKENCIVLTSVMDYSPIGSLYQTFSNKLSSVARQFPHLLIKSFPPRTHKRNFYKFIEVIGDQIEFLKAENNFIDDITVKKLFKMMPNLEKVDLPIEFENFEKTDFPPKLKDIHVNLVAIEYTKFINFKKIENLETLTAHSIDIMKISLNEFLVSYCDPILSGLLSGLVNENDDDYDSIEVGTKFNFCSDTKLSTSDITILMLNPSHGQVSYEFVKRFTNLKHLQLNTNHYDFAALLPQTSDNEPKTFSGITHLYIMGCHNELNLGKFLQIFPDLESLSLDYVRLKYTEFGYICKCMPKLKELTISESNQKISMQRFLATDRPSLHNLKFLEKLSIEVTVKTSIFTRLQWPALPFLKELSLSGVGIRDLSGNFYAQIAEKCPNLEDLTIDYEPCKNYSSLVFLPLLSVLKLKELTLPSNDHNGHLTHFILDHCENLENVSLLHRLDFTLEQEIQLFGGLPKLQSIEFQDFPWRVATRCQFRDLKSFVAANLYSYKDFQGTINYMYDKYMTPEERDRFSTSYSKSFPITDAEHDNFKKTCIVIQDYLKLDLRKYCKKLYDKCSKLSE